MSSLSLHGGRPRPPPRPLGAPPLRPPRPAPPRPACVPRPRLATPPHLLRASGGAPPRSRTAAAGQVAQQLREALQRRPRRPSPPPGAAPSPPRPAGCPRRAPGTGPAKRIRGLRLPASSSQQAHRALQAPGQRAGCPGIQSPRLRGRQDGQGAARTLPVTPEREGRGRTGPVSPRYYRALFLTVSSE